MNKHWKVFRFNEQDSVAAPDFESGLAWYMKVHQITREEALDVEWAPYERNIHDSIWTAEDEVLTEAEKSLPLEKAEFEGIICVKVSFERILQESNSEEPFIIAVSEI